MFCRDGTTAPLQTSTDVHQAAHVDPNNYVSAGGLDIVDLRIHHGRGHLRHLDREESAKSAALVFALEIDTINPGVGEQLLRLAKHTQPSQAMARSVIGGNFAPSPVGDEVRLFDEELGQLASAPGDSSGFGRVFGIARDQLGVVVNDHRRTRSGRNDDGSVGAIENIERLFGHCRGLGRKPPVERRLATACLVPGELDPAPCFFE